MTVRRDREISRVVSSDENLVKRALRKYIVVMRQKLTFNKKVQDFFIR